MEPWVDEVKVKDKGRCIALKECNRFGKFLTIWTAPNL